MGGGRTDERTNRRTNRQMYGWIDGRTNESPPVFYRISSPSGPLPKNSCSTGLCPLQGHCPTSLLQFTITQIGQQVSLTTNSAWVTCSVCLSGLRSALLSLRSALLGSGHKGDNDLYYLGNKYTDSWRKVSFITHQRECLDK